MRGSEAPEVDARAGCRGRARRAPRAAGTGSASTNSRKNGAGVDAARSPATRRGALARRSASSGTHRSRHLAQPLAAEQRQVDRGAQRDQALVGADVRGRLLAPDVLLAGLQREHEAAAALLVHGLADDAARACARTSSLRAGEEAAAPGRRSDGGAPRRLRLADHDVGAERARAARAARARSGRRRPRRARPRLAPARAQRGQASSSSAEEVRVLEDHAGDVGVERRASSVGGGRAPAAASGATR